MTVIVVTRPAHEAQAWVKRLEEAGLGARALPLIEIGDAPDRAQLLRARQSFCSHDAAMFVSAQAVERFWSGFDWPGCQDTRLWAPGPGTAAALLRHGVPLDRIDQPAHDAAQFDSEALWVEVASQVHPGHRLLVVRGASAATASQNTDVGQRGNGREWLASQCRAAGGEIAWCVAYERHAPVWDADTRERAAALAGSQAIWLFSSTEAVTHLRSLCPDAHWGNARALATHPRIADAARDLGFGEVRCTRPAVADVLHALESMS
jgi:uroporphyrinogen-III synthase